MDREKYQQGVSDARAGLPYDKEKDNAWKCGWRDWWLDLRAREGSARRTEEGRRAAS